MIDMLSSLQGQAAVVFGAGAVFGPPVVAALQAAGATVAAIDEQPLEKLYADLPDAERPLVVPADLRDPDRVAAAYAAVDQHHGELAVVINAAGATGALDRAAEELTEAQWQEGIERTLDATFWSCQQAARRMLPLGRGSIVNITSLAGVLIARSHRAVADHAARSGVNMLTKALAVEWGGRGVRVNAVAPGGLAETEGRWWGEGPQPGCHGHLDRATDRAIAAVPLGRLGRLDDIVPLVLFLCSGASSYLTGQTVVVDGGRGLLFD